METTNAVVLHLDVLLRPVKRTLRRQGQWAGRPNRTLTAQLGPFTCLRGGASYGTVFIDLTLGHEHGLARLTYRVDHWTGSVEATSQPVELMAAPCGFGGRRWHWRCPLSGQRCRTLYLPAGTDRFASRAAYRLPYDCQNKNVLDSNRSRAAKLRARLGAPVMAAGIVSYVPPRPRFMRHQTYERVVGELRARDQRTRAELDQMSAALLQHSHRANPPARYHRWQSH